MAKKKKGKKRLSKKKRDTKAKASPAEIRAYYKEHNWKETMSHFGIAPKDLSPIVKGKKKKAAAPKKRKKVKKKRGKRGKTAEAPYGFKKDGTPKKPPGRKSGKKKKAAAPRKKKSVKKRRASTIKTSSAHRNSMQDIVLDWLLKYRGKKQKIGNAISLDSVIIDLTVQVRGV